MCAHLFFSTRGSNHQWCGWRVLNTLSVKYRVRTIMKIIQIFQILTVSQDTRQVPDNGQTYSEDEKSNQRPFICLRPPTIIKEHKGTITFGACMFHFRDSIPLQICIAFDRLSTKHVAQKLGVKVSIDEPVPMVGGIQLVVVIKAWQWVKS